MAKYIVEGGKVLKGNIQVNTAKNSAVTLLSASLLVKGKVVLKDVPRIQEVERILEILKSINVQVEWRNNRELELDTSGNLDMANIDKNACEVTRSSLLLFGALARREKKYKIYKSGGCRLGERTVRPHLFALNKLGVEVDSKNKYYEVKNKNVKGQEIVMYEAGDTPTENAIMASVLTPGVTVLKFASANYMVQDLCYFLNSAGANIKGIGTSILTITGVKSLKPVRGYPIMPDPIDAMAFISLAVTTKSDLEITNCPIDFLELELEKLRVMGQKMTLHNKRKSKNKKFNIADIKFEASKLTALPDKIHPCPFPGLNIDNLPFFPPILTQAEGRTLVHDWIYENRAIYYLELQKLGANIMLLDPHRLLVDGPTELKANELMCPPAIRPAMAILVAMIAAKGTSVLRNIYPIERAYEDLEQRLRKVGTKIRRIEN